MWIKDHCKECKEKLGDEFYEIHKWLDELTLMYPVEKYNDYHRQFRHNKEGVEYIRMLWGDEAAKAAELHILADMGYIQDWHTIDIPLD